MKTLKDEIPLEKLMSRQVRLWEQTRVPLRTGEERKIEPCITISREMGCPGLELAERLRRRLKWRVYDKNLVDYIAKDANVQKRMAESFDEKTQNEVHNWILTLLNHEALASGRYFKHLVTVLTSIGLNGRAIIVGRGANFLLPADRTLSVRLIAARDVRIAAVMKHETCSKNEAGIIVSLADKERLAFFRKFFHKDTDDCHNFDLVINADRFQLGEIEQMVLTALAGRFPDAEIE